MLVEISPALIWSALLLFILGAIIRERVPPYGTVSVAIGWVVFGLFWASMAGHFLLAKNSVIEAALALLALPLGLYAGYLTYTKQPPALFTFARAATVMGLIYLPVEQIAAIRRPIIEAVTVQTVWVVEAIYGHNLVIQEGPIYGYQSGIAAPNAPGGLLLTHIELACTGLGSIAIAVGLISVLREPLSQRIVAALIATGVIYAMNIIRTVFITSAYVGQWFQFYVPEVLAFTGYSDPRVTSFFIADKVISQSLSLLVLGALFLVMVRMFPSFHELVRDAQTLFE